MAVIKTRLDRVDTGPDVTPLVNIAMVILVVFMITVSFTEADRFLQSNVPFKATGEGQVATPEDFVPDEPLEVAVDAPVQNEFIARIGNQQANTVPGVRQILAQKAAEFGQINSDLAEIQVLISPEKGVHMEHLIAVYSAALEVGFSKVTFTTSR
ncbi:MAG: ExbD/TolR family protein [Phycisphaerae bacterium]